MWWEHPLLYGLRHLFFVKVEIFPSSAVLPTLNREERKSLKLSASDACAETCWNRSLVWSHKLSGESSATSARTLSKWALKFRIVTSAALCQWHPGGTNSISILYFLRMIAFITSETSLSRTCFLGTMPAHFNHVTKTWYDRVNSESFLLFLYENKMVIDVNLYL